MKNGFTLIELLITIAVSAILLSLGVPSFQNMIASNRSSSQAMNFIASLNLARSEAVKRNRTVQISATDGADWENGWQVWVDLDDDTDLDAGELLDESAGLAGGNRVAEAGGATQLTYTSTGRIAAGVTFTLTSSSGNAAHDKTLQIRPTGRVHVFGEH